MSSRYGSYDDPASYDRRNYTRDWERNERVLWDNRGPPGGGGRDWADHRRDSWDRPPYDHNPHWDRRDMDRMGPRDEWGRDRDVRGGGGGGGGWSRPPLPPPPPHAMPERDLYRDRDRDRHDRPMDWQPEPRGIVRKRDPEPYEDRDYVPVPRPPRTSTLPDDPEWKRRKVEPEPAPQAAAPPPQAAAPAHPPSSDAGPRPAGWEPEQGQRHHHEPSELSQHVIFLGLDPHFTEADLQGFLAPTGARLESVTIIRDKYTGLSRNFGFAQFADIAGASAFVTPNFPYVQVPPPAQVPPGYVADPAGKRVKIDFSPSNNRDPVGAGNRADAVAKATPKNDGTRDIGNSPAPVLLLRSLDRSTTIDEIATALKAADGSSGDGAWGMKRVILIKDRAANTSWGFAFIEMFDIESASALLGAIMNAKNYPTGFKIEDRLVAASFALPYAFQLLPQTSPKEPWCIVPSKAIGGVEEGEGWTRYWDESATVEEKTYEVQPRKVKPAVAASVSAAKAQAVADQVAAPTELQSMAGPVSIKLKTSKAQENTDSKAPVANALGFNADGNDNDELMLPVESTSAKTIAEVLEKGTLKPAPMIASNKVATNIKQWNNKAKEAATPETTEQSPAPPAASETGQSKPIPEHLPGDPGFEYGDPIQLTCLLCLRQLKTLNQLERHNKESEMHKNNLRNNAACKQAAEKIASNRRNVLSGQPPKRAKPKNSVANTDGNSSDTKYRDRAQERRRVHNQPDVPVPPPAPSAPQASNSKPGTIIIPPSVVKPVDVGEDADNVGNKLLKKMGWEEGSGLGVEGEGRAEPVKAAVYAAGAGIGASKGREVTSFTPTSFKDAAADITRERYSQTTQPQT